MQEVTVIEKINSGINIFIIYSFPTPCSCSACQRMNKDGAAQPSMPRMSCKHSVAYGRTQKFSGWSAFKEALLGFKTPLPSSAVTWSGEAVFEKRSKSPGKTVPSLVLGMLDVLGHLMPSSLGSPTSAPGSGAAGWQPSVASV